MIVPLWAGSGSSGLAWWVFVLWLAAVGWSDFRSRRIGNVLIAGAAMAAVLLIAARGGPDEGALRSILMAVLLVVALFVPSWLLGYMGAADVKLALVLAVWGGHQSLTLMWVMASVMAMAHALVLLAMRLARQRAEPRLTVPAAGEIRHEPIEPPRRLIPYGGYLAVAGLILALAALVRH